MYARKPIVLLDDIFSGLDSVTEDIIFRSLFGTSGLLRRESQTVVIATHAVHFLSTVDHVILLGEHSEVVYQGNYSDFPLEMILMRDLSNPTEPADLEKGIITEHTDSVDAEEFVPSIEPMSTDVDTVAPDISRQMGDSTIYMYYLRSMGLKHAILFALLGAICMGFTPAQSRSPFLGLSRALTDIMQLCG